MKIQLRKLMRLAYIFLFTSLISLSCTKEIIQQKLSVSVSPINSGSVTPPSNSYEKGQSLQMLATPAGEYIFKEWEGDLRGTSNPSTLVMDTDKVITGKFEKRQYPLNLTIDGSGTVKEEIIAVATQSQYPSGTTVRLTPQPLEGWVFSGWSGDLTSTKNPIDLIINKITTIKATFSKLRPLSILFEPFIEKLSVSNEVKITANIVLENNSILKNISNFEIAQISGTGKVTILNNRIVAAQSGSAVIKFKYENLEKLFTLEISPFEEIKEIDTYLSAKNPTSKLRVPVVVINYYPTLNGIDIDTRRAPSFGSLDPITIQNLKIKTIDNLKLTKFGIEEGSKFRGYLDKNATPYVGVDVVKFYNFYEIKKGTFDKVGGVVYEPDFTDMFSKINLKDLVEIQGVKEVWISLRPLGAEYPVVKTENLSPDNFINVPESRMSSPYPPFDVSNSNRLLTLPKYNKTFVVYGYNLHRSYAENLHNRGHQIERELTHIDDGVVPGLQIDKSLFRNLFSGETTSIPYIKPKGRSGNTHFPPNGVSDYDYNNTNAVLSDIEDWKPSGGIQKLVNNKTWINKLYAYPMTSTVKIDENDAQFKWLIYWFQSIPGYANNIDYLYYKDGKQYKLENWWDLFYNWDDVMVNKKTLWKK